MMAEFLIKVLDTKHPNPIKDQQKCYKRGDIVVVKPDGHNWGKEEGLPKFVKIKIPGLPVSEKYIDPEIDEIDKSKIIRRRKFRILLDNLPNTIINKLKKNGEITITPDKLKNFIHNKQTDKIGW